MRITNPSKGSPVAVAPVGEGKIPGFVETPRIVPPQQADHVPPSP
jgi:hypothetical protein